MNPFRVIWNRYRGWITVYVLSGIAIAFLTTYSANYYQRIIDRFADGTLDLVGILLYGGVLIGLCLLNYLDEYPGRKLEHGVFLSLKVMALEKMRVIDYLAYQGVGTGTLVQRIETGSAAGRDMLCGFWLCLLRQLLPSMGFSLFFIGRISVPVLLAILAGYAVVFAVTRLLLSALTRIKERILVNEESLTHTLVRGFMELVVFRVNRRFAREITRAKAAQNEIVGAKIHMTMIHEAFFTIFALLVTVLKVGILIYAWKTRSITIGAAVALLALVDNAYTPIAIFNVLLVQYRLDKTAYARYAAFLGLPDDPQLTSGTPAPAQGDIDLRNVAFSYGSRPVFSGLNVQIASGERVALVGESGSGKSTLIKLLMGLIKPSGGEIRIGGQDMTHFDLNDYYGRVAYVSQDTPVFDGTLRENLVFDAPKSEDDLRRALDEAGLSRWFAGLPDGLDTQLGERGVTLSGGERQRLALARLSFSSAGLVVLDEATSAMDNLTERAVMTQVMARMEGRTVLVIAHRLESVRDFPRIMVFREGQLHARGTFASLMEQDGYFRGLYRAYERREKDAAGGNE
ncbi:MAG: ABC transporter ATP-binding protein [Eubacteriales bacterium]|nr:ABC transporter ATP-binding protein [Eubacteriales bacterium]